MRADRHGKYDHSKQQIARDRKQFTEDHIRSVPVSESHYTRVHSEGRQYLSANSNIRKITICGNMKRNLSSTGVAARSSILSLICHFVNGEQLLRLIMYSIGL